MPVDELASESCPPALTTLAEDERLFLDSVYEFADREIRPLVREMDESAHMPRALIDKLFALGVMGIEVPESAGGAGGYVLSRRARSRGALARRSVDRRARGRSEHAGHQRDAPVGRRRAQAALPGAACRRLDRRLCAVGSRLGSDAFALATRASESADGFRITGRKLWITNANEADLFIVFANVNPEAGYRGITAFVVERGLRPDSPSARKRTNSGSGPAARAN